MNNPHCLRQRLLLPRGSLARLLYLLMLGAAASCTSADDRAPHSLGPLFNVVFDCQLTPARCGEIDNAIVYLETSTNLTCQEMGQTARDRYLAAGYGFRETDHYGWYGATWPNDPNSYMGVNQQSGNTFGNDQLANTVAHEESHFAGYTDDPGGGAYEIGDSCGYGYSSGTHYQYQPHE